MTEFFNRPTEEDLRKRLRNEMPKAEVILWSQLQRRQLYGLKFRRQYSVGPCMIDFYCPEAMLAVEVDGDSHFTPEARQADATRQQNIERFGIRFFRCTNLDVFENLEGDIEAIAAAAKKKPKTARGYQTARAKRPPLTLV